VREEIFVTGRYCIIGEHAISDGGTSCTARAKALTPTDIAGPHQSGVRHAQHDGAGETGCNLADWPGTRTVQPLSARVKGARSENFGLSAEVFSESLKWAQVSRVDAAVAIGHNSATGVNQMARGERTIPADAVYVWMRRLPELGLRILAFCAAELPEKQRARLPGMIDEAVEIRRRMGWGSK
jgi:hypothetical protein